MAANTMSTTTAVNASSAASSSPPSSSATTTTTTPSTPESVVTPAPRRRVIRRKPAPAAACLHPMPRGSANQTKRARSSSDEDETSGEAPPAKRPCPAPKAASFIDKMKPKAPGQSAGEGLEPKKEAGQPEEPKSEMKFLSDEEGRYLSSNLRKKPVISSGLFSKSLKEGDDVVDSYHGRQHAKLVTMKNGRERWYYDLPGESNRELKKPRGKGDLHDKLLTERSKQLAKEAKRYVRPQAKPITEEQKALRRILNGGKKK